MVNVRHGVRLEREFGAGHESGGFGLPIFNRKITNCKVKIGFELRPTFGDQTGYA
jgi:hypothetical protein